MARCGTAREFIIAVSLLRLRQLRRIDILAREILFDSQVRGFVGRELSFDYAGQSTVNSSSIAFQVTRKTVSRTFPEHMLSDRLYPSVKKKLCNYKYEDGR